MDNITKLRPELFGVRCEVCGQSILYADYMTIIISTTKKAVEITAIKIKFLIAELGNILQSNGLMLNADKTELLRTTKRQLLAANCGERLFQQTKNKKGDNI